MEHPAAGREDARSSSPFFPLQVNGVLFALRSIQRLWKSENEIWFSEQVHKILPHNLG